MSKIFYECCKLKELKCYCCVVCLNIFHKGCCGRKNGMILIDKHKIYCSEECQNNENTRQEKYENELSEYIETISSLNLQIEEQAAYIQRLVKLSKAFEIDAMENEQSCKQEIAAVRTTICLLKEELKQKNSDIERLKDETSEVKEECSELQEMNLKYKNEIALYRRGIDLNLSLNENKNGNEEYSTIEENLGPTKSRNALDKTAKSVEKTVEMQKIRKCILETNEKEVNKPKVNGKDTCQNTSLFDELRQATEDKQSENLESEDDNSLFKEYYEGTKKTGNDKTIEDKPKKINDDGKTTEQPADSTRVARKGKILIVGDEYAKNFARVLDLVIDTSQYKVDELVDPRKELSELSKNIFDKSIDYGTNDYVIIMFNTKNVSNNRTLNLALKNILPASRLINIIIISECHKPIDNRINKKIMATLSRFKKSNKNYSCLFLRDYKKNGSKIKLCNSIKYFLTRPVNSIVLKTIVCKEDISSVGTTGIINVNYSFQDSQSIPSIT